MIVIFGIFGILVFIGLFCLYALIMNEKTSRERTKLIRAHIGETSNVKFLSAEYLALEKEYCDTSYDKHFWHNILWRDWRKLYPKLGKAV